MNTELIRALSPFFGFLTGGIIGVTALVSGATGESLNFAQILAINSITAAAGVAVPGKKEG